MMPRALPDRSRASDEGFTLIELVICVAIVGMIAVALTGVIISELRNDTVTAARMDESFDVQFATTYWQRDVASIGVRTQTPTAQSTADPYALVYATQQSVFTDGSNACALVGVGGTAAQRTAVVTLAWSEYDPSAIPSVASTVDADGDGIPDDDAPRAPYKVRVTWVVKADPTTGAAPYELWRVRCSDPGAPSASANSAVRIGRNLSQVPTLVCTWPTGSSGRANCDPNGTTSLPRTVSMQVSSLAGHDTTVYTATLTGERRES